MPKRKFTAKGAWPVSESVDAKAKKGDPKKLRLRAEELKRQSANLANEAGGLLALAEQIENQDRKRKPREDTNQAAHRVM